MRRHLSHMLLPVSKPELSRNPYIKLIFSGGQNLTLHHNDQVPHIYTDYEANDLWPLFFSIVCQVNVEI